MTRKQVIKDNKVDFVLSGSLKEMISTRERNKIKEDEGENNKLLTLITGREYTNDIATSTETTFVGDLNLVYAYFGWDSEYFTANAQTILVGEYIDSETLWKIGKAIEEFNEYRRNIEIEIETEN